MSATNGNAESAVEIPNVRFEMKTEPAVTADEVQLAIRTRFNPIRGLTPQVLSQYLDQFNLGWIAYAALLWDMIERRDDTLKNVAGKRKKDAARLEWQIVTKEGDNVDEKTAELHKEALQEFYENLSCVNALDENERGGFQLLVRQMMDAVGKKYAVHEIVWQPGDVLTAEFRFVPLWFFENRTGRLQILKIPLGGATGEPLEDGGWMITSSDGLMEACSVAYMFKNLPLKDWLAYSDKFGTPGVLGQTNASRDSEAGKAMRDAISAFGQNWSAVVYGADGSIKEPIRLIEAKSGGESGMPFPGIIERMDRAMISLWRGSDLATMSRGGAERSVGASVQQDESAILLRDDADLISETLNLYVDRLVLWQRFGVERGLAKIQLRAPEDRDTEMDIKVDELLLKAGARLGEKATLKFYGRPEFDESGADVALHSPIQTTEQLRAVLDQQIAKDAGVVKGGKQPGGKQPGVKQPGVNDQAEQLVKDETLSNTRRLVRSALAKAEKEFRFSKLRSRIVLDLVEAEIANVEKENADLGKYLGEHRAKFLKAFANDLQPLRQAIESALAPDDEPTQRAHLQTLRAQLGHVLKHVSERGTAAPVLAEIIANALKLGADKAQQQTQPKK